MKHGKQLIILFISLFIALSPLAECSLSFAEAGNGGGGGVWDPISDEATLVAAFKAYCSRRNFNISHEPAIFKQIVNWDYEQIKLKAAFYNINLDSLNAHIWYTYNNNGFLKFYFDQIGLSTLSGIYSKIVEEYNIPTNGEQVLYSGEWFEDNYGDGCNVFYTTGSGSGNFNQVVKYGTFYKYLGADCFKNNIDTLTFDINSANNNLSYTFTRYNSNSEKYLMYGNGGYIYHSYNSYPISIQYIIGGPTVIKTNNVYYLGTYCRAKWSNGSSTTNYCYWSTNLRQLAQPNVKNISVTGNQGALDDVEPNKSLEVQTGDKTINNYITNNNPTYIYNYYDDDTPPSPPPYTNPYNDNPTGGIIGSDGSINFQMPDLNIDWNLDFGDNPPFPFSIPFDIIDFLNAFNTEPVTPHIEETITIANMDIDIDIDLEWLDDVAGYFRTFILLSYTIGLIVATRALFHIY